MKKRRITSLLLSIVALSLIVYFFSTTQLSVEFSMYFKPEYYLKYSLLIISLMLINAAFLLFKNDKGANLSLAIFGYTILEEIIFDLLGITSVNMPLVAYIVLFACALPSLWIAHSNTFNTEKLSTKGLVISLAIGALESLYPILI
ncbi:hypothetical protein [Roseivirga misakiensis]|uniref:Uncharacterized protein n=1 Tax=Roseivirga misakiensis TaxID=1563681 RepID=A0A1E5SY34_9BACT|nr:hypothetical protein [Roseivirga misakiensis]OEK04025.1 hypothetical protein BFP71_11045 [Roseivirga misakiensis]